MIEKLRIGTTIQIKSLDWYNNRVDKNSKTIIFPDNSFIPDMVVFCGKKGKIIEYCGYNNYRLSIDEGKWNWTPEMFTVIHAENSFSDIYKLGKLYVIVDAENKKVYPEFFSSEEEAQNYRSKL